MNSFRRQLDSPHRWLAPRALALGAALTLAVVSTACTTRIGDLTVGSSKNIPTAFAEVAPTAEGKDCANVLLFIPLGVLNPTIDGAIDDALDKHPEADALTDVTLHNTILFTFFFNQTCVRVKGTPIRTRG